MNHFVEQAQQHLTRTAIIAEGRAYSYKELLVASAEIAHLLLQQKADLAEARIAFLVRPGFDYVKTQWGIWRAGGIAVPLCTQHPLPSIRYVLEDTEASTLIVSEDYWDFLSPLAEELNLQYYSLGQLLATEHGELP
ncbi:MAG: AMP-binding protein, partial [Bacteroidota bacterium]